MKTLLALIVLVSPGYGADRAALDKRIDEVSKSFLGAPYKLGPLGEGPKGQFDRDPLVRYDQFDCTTYVETVAALSLEPDKPKAEKLLQRIRYENGKTDFVSRRHFPETDWIPGLIRDGFLEDITREVAGDKTKVATKKIRKGDWFRSLSTAALEGFDGAPEAERQKRAADLRALGARFGAIDASLPYLPLEDLPEFLDKIPDGTVANLVREDLPDKFILVTHQVFFFSKDGRKIVRHAAFGKKVQEEDALAYFYKYFNGRWKLLGLNLNRIARPK
jgi:hypothetical protein